MSDWAECSECNDTVHRDELEESLHTPGAMICGACAEIAEQEEESTDE